VSAPAVLDLDMPEDDVLRVLRWRFCSLARAGFAPSDALMLAAAPDVDLHVAEDMLSVGCPSETVVRILL
jgi:hypothetical protein